MSARTVYVEVSEHYSNRDFVPFSSVRRYVPGKYIVGRLYGPFTPAGAERVTRRALSDVADTFETYPSGVRYAHYVDDYQTRYTRVVTVHARMPSWWARHGATRRNMPAN